MLRRTQSMEHGACKCACVHIKSMMLIDTETVARRYGQSCGDTNVRMSRATEARASARTTCSQHAGDNIAGPCAW
jgi:hypothetical protein